MKSIVAAKCLVWFVFRFADIADFTHGITSLVIAVQVMELELATKIADT